MSARTGYVCQIQGCNVLLIILGMGAVALAGSQFSRVGIDTIRDIDLRLLNWIHILTGSIGIFSVWRNHGSIVTKTLYCVSIVIGIASAIFYGFTTYRVVEASRQLQLLQQTPGFDQEYGQENVNFAGRIAISATMIGICALAALVSMVAVLVLDRLVVLSYPIYPIPNREAERTLERARKSVLSLAVLKVSLALGLVGLSAFLEYEHELVKPMDRYIQIALEHIAAMLAVCSAVVDFVAVRSRRQESLNLKVAIALSIIASVWCYKTVDNNAVPFYKNDLKAYYLARDTGDQNLIGLTSPRYIIIIVHGVLLGCFCLLALLCAFSAVAAAVTLLCTDRLSVQQEPGSAFTMHDRLIGVLHFIWAGCLMGLCIIGFLDLPWRGEYLGGDHLWTSVLFLGASIVVSSNHTVHITTRFIFNIVCLGVAVEKCAASIHLIYEYSAYSLYRNGNQGTYIGQIVLICITTGVYGFESLTALVGSIVFGRALSRQQISTYRHSPIVHYFFSLGTLYYAVVITGCYVVYELGKWRFNEVPIDVPFFRLGNGPFAFGVFVVQMICACHPNLLAASALLHAVVGALALFTLSSCITNVYFLANVISAGISLGSTQTQFAILTVAVILAAGATLACVLATFTSAICALRSSYLLHHKSTSTNSTVVAPLEEHFGSLQHSGDRVGPGDLHHPRVAAYYSNQGAVPPADASRIPGVMYGGVNPQSPIHIQPMEEQSVYWSADENPYYYHASKRFYGQPYQIESGFYGYPTTSDGQHPHHRRVQSSAAQTQLGHTFD